MDNRNDVLKASAELIAKMANSCCGRSDGFYSDVYLTALQALRNAYRLGEKDATTNGS